MSGLALIVFVCGIVYGFIVGTGVERLRSRPPKYISSCVSIACHKAGRECPACGPNRADSRG